MPGLEGERPSAAGDLAQAVRTAVINKRAGGMGLISGRKAFQRPMAEGVKLLHAIQDVYLDPELTIAYSRIFSCTVCYCRSKSSRIRRC